MESITLFQIYNCNILLDQRWFNENEKKHFLSKFSMLKASDYSTLDINHFVGGNINLSIQIELRNVSLNECIYPPRDFFSRLPVLYGLLIEKIMSV
jgi:hypothetical protein